MKTVIITLQNGLETGEFIARMPLAQEESTALQIFTEIVKHTTHGVVTLQYPMRLFTKQNGTPTMIPYNNYAEKDVLIRARLIDSMAEVPAAVVNSYNKTIETFEALMANKDIVKKLAEVLVQDGREEAAAEDKIEKAVKMAETNAPTVKKTNLH